MKSDVLLQILGLVKAYNPENHYINNKGLSSLGALLFYPKAHEIEESNKIKEILKRFFPKDKKERDFNFNLRTIDSNLKNSTAEFPYEKAMQIQNIEKEIKNVRSKIKR